MVIPTLNRERNVMPKSSSEQVHQIKHSLDLEKMYGIWKNEKSKLAALFLSKTYKITFFIILLASDMY